MRRGTTRSGRIRLVNPVDHRAHADNFLSEVAHELAVGPLADLLVGLLAEAHARLNVTHIPDRDLGHPLLLAKVHHLTCGLIENVALLAIELGADPGFLVDHSVTLYAPIGGSQHRCRRIL